MLFCEHSTTFHIFHLMHCNFPFLGHKLITRQLSAAQNRAGTCKANVEKRYDGFTGILRQFTVFLKYLGVLTVFGGRLPLIFVLKFTIYVS